MNEEKKQEEVKVKDPKFILILPPASFERLEKEAKEMGMYKAEIVRAALDALWEKPTLYRAKAMLLQLLNRLMRNTLRDRYLEEKSDE